LTFGEKVAATAIWAAMKAKIKIGMEDEEEKNNEQADTSDSKT